MQGIRGWLAGHAGTVTAIIGLMTAVAGVVTLFRNDRSLALLVSIGIAVAAAILSALYVVTAKETDLLGPPRPAFSKRTRVAASIGAIAAVAACIAFVALRRIENLEASRYRVVICELDRTSNAIPIHVRQRLHDDLTHRLRALRITGVGIEMDGAVVHDEAEARELAARHRAAAVLWGWSDAEEVGIRVWIAEPRMRLVAPDTEHVPWYVPGRGGIVGVHGKPALQQAAFISMFVAGQLLYLDNRWAEGAAAFDEAMRLLPPESSLENPALAHFFRARALHFSQTREVSDEAVVPIVCGYATAIRLQPNFYQAYNNLGILFAQRQERDDWDLPDDADRCLKRVNLDELSDPFEAAANIQPNVAAIEYNRLAAEWSSWYGFGDEGDARFAAELQAVLKRDPTLAGAHMMLGVIAFDRGDYRMAQREFAHAARQQPDIPGIHTNLAQAARCAGDRKTAETALANALARDPADELAQIARASMQFIRGDPSAAAALVGGDPTSLLLRAGALARRREFRKAAEVARGIPTDETWYLPELFVAVLQELAGSGDGHGREAWIPARDYTRDYGVVYTSALGLAERQLARECSTEDGDRVTVRTIRERCVRGDAQEVLDRIVPLVADQTKYALRSRRIRWAGAACPYVYIVDGDRRQFATAILVNHRGPEREAVSRNNLPPAFTGTLEIREREPEVTYLDHVRVEYSYGDGRPESHVAAIGELRAIDRRYRVMRSGDVLTLRFPPPRSPVVRATLVASGYYVPER